METKPGGLDHARPLKDLKLPGCFGILRRRLERPDGLGTREFIRVLRLLEHASVKQLAGAIEYGLGIGVLDADSMRVILEHRREAPVTIFSLEGRPHLKTVHVDSTDVVAYQSLLTGI